MHQGTLLLYWSNLVCLTQKYNKQTLFCCWLFKSYERGLRKEKFLLVFHRKETINICSRKISYFWWWQLFVDVELIIEERSGGGEGGRRWAVQVQNEIESDDEEIEFYDLTHKVAIDDSISTSAATTTAIQKLLWRMLKLLEENSVLKNTQHNANRYPFLVYSTTRWMFRSLRGCCKGQDGYLWTRSSL